MSASRSWYDRHVLPRVLGCACSAPAIMDLRRRIVPEAHGRVLELGAGGGLNLRFYDPSQVSEVVGVDPSVELRAAAERAERSAGLAVTLVDGQAEALPFPNGSFDSVVCTFTLCSVRSPQAALSEVRRVLRPGGRLLFAEHGLAPDAGVARWQARLDGLWGGLAGGCHLTRDVGAALREAGMTRGDVASAYLPGLPKLVGWSRSGWAAS